MSEATHESSAAHGDHGDEAAHLKHYAKIYWTLVILFAISYFGPFVGEMIGSKAIVLVTAFGIALIKAYLVCAHFMHLNVEKKYVIYLLTTAVAFMFLFYAGVAPDVMEHHGRNWENVAAKQETERALKAAQHGHAHEGGHEEHGDQGHAH